MEHDFKVLIKESEQHGKGFRI